MLREGVLDRRDALDIMHGRSRMTIDPLHPYNAGTEHVGFSSTRQTLLAPSAKRCEVFSELHGGQATSYEELLLIP